MKKILVILGALYLYAMPVYAESNTIMIDVSEVESITIVIDGNSETIDIAEAKRMPEARWAEQEAIQAITSQEMKVYTSDAAKIYADLKENYTVEEVKKEGKFFWKCTPKNPEAIKVKKQRTKEYTDSQGNSVHEIEYYEEEFPNPGFLTAEQLEKKIVWYEITKKDVSKTEPSPRIDGMEDSKPERGGGILGAIFGLLGQ